MQNQGTNSGPIMRLFQVHAKPGRAHDLMRSFATTSADVVRNEPGNKGYFFGRAVSTDDDFVLFASFWTDLEAVKDRFGEDWQHSFLPPGYEDWIDTCSVTHVDLGQGWHVRLDP